MVTTNWTGINTKWLFFFSLSSVRFISREQLKVATLQICDHIFYARCVARQLLFTCDIPIMFSHCAGSTNLVLSLSAPFCLHAWLPVCLPVQEVESSSSVINCSEVFFCCCCTFSFQDFYFHNDYSPKTIWIFLVAIYCCLEFKDSSEDCNSRECLNETVTKCKLHLGSIRD